MTFPAANELDRPRDTDEWKRMLVQLDALLSGLGETRPLDANESELRKNELVQVARAELPRVLQIPAEKAAAMSDDEAGVRWYVRVRANMDQLACAALCLPPHDAWPRFKEYDAEVKAIQDKCKMYPLEFFDPNSVYLPVWSLRRRVAALRIIEAVRDYLAAHDGKLPASLANITTVPLPMDPLTDEPFEWKVDGNSATLKALFLPSEPNKEGSFENRISFHLKVE
jgi:hypothetical protein